VFKADIDRPKLERSLKRFAKDFGETNAQALVRWSVNACRELAFETQVWGRSKTKGKQEGAILADSYNVLLVVDKLTPAGRSYRVQNQGKSYSVRADQVLTDAEAINDWIEVNRTRRRGRTAKLPPTERMVCDAATHKKAMRVRYARAGMAKGGWIGAGQDIATAQKGQDRITIGKNYLSYAHKHAKFGSAKRPRGGWSPFAEITNRVAHSSNKNVLTSAAPARAFAWSLKKTVKWYATALRKQNQKQKP
jgi:hypothetical protein